jgi:hypothetical protein
MPREPENCLRKLFHAALLGMSLASSGCASLKGVHLYNSADDKIATEALASFKDAKIDETVAEERKLQDRLLARELAGSDRLADATRDSVLLAAISGPNKQYSWDFLDGEIDGRIAKLIGSKAEGLKVGAQEQSVKHQTDAFEVAEQVYNAVRTKKDPSLNDPSFACTDANAKSIESTCSSPKERFSSVVTQQLFCSPNGYQDSCSKFLEAVKDSTVLVDSHSILGRIDTQISEQEQIRDADQKALDEKDPNSAISRYHDAKKALDDAQKPGGMCAQSLKSSQPSCLQRASAAVRSALQALEKASDPASSLKAHEEKIAAIDEVLQSVTDGKSAAKAADSPDQRSALSVVASIPSLGEQIGSSFNRPSVGSLILESERLRLEAEALRRDLSRRETHLTLLREKRNATVNEVNLLLRTRKYLSLDDPFAKNCHEDDKGLLADYRAFPTQYCREVVAAGLVAYAQSWNAGRKQEEEEDYRLIALSYTESLDKTELALMQWQNLIQVPLSQTATYYASGIKPDDIAKFLQAAGIAATAAGVNR